jgi:hypothetical protein
VLGLQGRTREGLAGPNLPGVLAVPQALAYLNAKCGDSYMRSLVSNSMFCHVSTQFVRLLDTC